MGYMIEGGGSKTMSKAKNWLTAYPEDAKKLLQMLTDAIVDYLEMQVKAGAQLLQIFESSAEHLSKEDFIKWCVPYIKEISEKLKQRLTEQSIPLVPMVNILRIHSFLIQVYLQCFLFLDFICQGRWPLFSRTGSIGI